MCGARTKRVRRIAKAFPIAEKFADFGRSCDSDWMTRRHSAREPFELALPLSVNARYDEALNESNFEVARTRLDAVAAFGSDYRVDLWPGGQIHTLTIRADDALAIREAERIVDALQEYAALDEDDWSRREWEANHPDEMTCYAEFDDQNGEKDCGCGSAARKWEADHEDDDWCGSSDRDCPCGRN